MSSSPVLSIQLLLVRSIFDRSHTAANEHTAIGNMLAMILADTAVETLVKEALLEKRVSFGREDISKLLDLLEKKVPTLNGRPEMPMAQRLRNSRNPVQHSGSVPDSVTVAAHLRDAEAFLSLVVREVFGCDFAAVSAVTMVASEDLRAALEHASAVLKSGNPDEASLFTVGTFDAFRIRWGRWLRFGLGKRTDFDAALPSILSLPAYYTFGSEHDDTSEPKTLNGAWRDIATAMIGLSIPDLVRIRVLRQRADMVLSAKRAGGEPTGAPASPALVASCIDSLARAIWRMESLHPEMLGSVPLNESDQSEEGEEEIAG